MYVGRTCCNENLFLNVNMLPVVDRVEDLGVVIDSHLTFTYHIHQIVAIYSIRPSQLDKQMFCIT